MSSFQHTSQHHHYVAFSAYDFRVRVKTRGKIPLCAGLIQVWWSRLQKTGSGIGSLQSGNTRLVREVLILQARSAYLSEPALLDGRLSKLAETSLVLKYGISSICELQKLVSTFSSQSQSELDLCIECNMCVHTHALDHDVTVEKLNALIASPSTAFHIFVHQRKGSYFGHRTAVYTDGLGVCRYYDPDCGEFRFHALRGFCEWFSDKLGREHLTESTNLLSVGGQLTPQAHEERVRLQRRFWKSTRAVSLALASGMPAHLLIGDLPTCSGRRPSSDAIK